MAFPSASRMDLAAIVRDGWYSTQVARQCRSRNSYCIGADNQIIGRKSLGIEPRWFLRKSRKSRQPRHRPPVNKEKQLIGQTKHQWLTDGLSVCTDIERCLTTSTVFCEGGPMRELKATKRERQTYLVRGYGQNDSGFETIKSFVDEEFVYKGGEKVTSIIAG